ncbi:hypothetical protein [Brevundimonas sp.]|uniref:hypothetical protein n=1 Tax=Brevundimonas sp. TaxID=1871086 RepID=UPI0028A5FFAE|nr:hypothetical protein [Brevundimonas sp.]
MTRPDLDALEKLADDRAVVLDVCADLYEEIAAFMDDVTSRTFAAYDSARDKPELHALMRKHRQALAIRDDYKGLARENREDAEIYRAFLARNGKGER